MGWGNRLTVTVDVDGRAVTVLVVLATLVRVEVDTTSTSSPHLTLSGYCLGCDPEGSTVQTGGNCAARAAAIKASRRCRIRTRLCLLVVSPDGTEDASGVNPAEADIVVVASRVVVTSVEVVVVKVEVVAIVEVVKNVVVVEKISVC